MSIWSAGRSWGPSTIYGNWQRGTGILNNELYIGRRLLNRQRFIKDPATGRRQARLNPEAKWIIEEVPHLRIQRANMRTLELENRCTGDRTVFDSHPLRSRSFLHKGLLGIAPLLRSRLSSGIKRTKLPAPMRRIQ